MGQKSSPISDEVRDLQFLIEEGLEMLAIYKSIADRAARMRAVEILKEMAAAQAGNSH